MTGEPARAEAKTFRFGASDGDGLTATVDGGRFNVHPPPKAEAPWASIPGVGLNGRLKSLQLGEEDLAGGIAIVGAGRDVAFRHLLSQALASMTEDDAAVVFDSGGGLLGDFRREGDAVISGRAGRPDGEGWNVFGEIDPGDPDGSIREIGRIAFGPGGGASAGAAREAFCACLSMFYSGWRERHGRDPTNADLVSFFKSADPGCLAKALAEGGFGSAAGCISGPMAQTAASELSSAAGRVFAGGFGGSGSLALSRLVRERGGRAAFVEHDPKAGMALGAAYSLMMDMALREALDGRPGRKGSVYFFIDELRLLPGLTRIEDAVSLGRGLGVKAVVGTESVAQLRASLGELKAESVLSGFRTRLFFNVPDSGSRRHIREHFGRCFKRVERGPGQDSVYLDDVVRDGDIARLGAGEAIVGLQGCEPFKFQFAPWRPEEAEPAEPEAPPAPAGMRPTPLDLRRRRGLGPGSGTR